MKFKDKERIFEDEASRVKRNKNLQWPAKFDTYKLVENRCYVFSIYDQENKAELVLESSKALSGLTFEVNWLDVELIDVLCRNERYDMTYGVRTAIPCPESRKFAIGTLTNLGKVIAHLDDFSIYYVERAGSDGQMKYSCHHWHSVFAVKTKPVESVIQRNNPFSRIRYYNTSISSLYGKFFRFGIDFNPGYQRQSCWTMKQKLALIDSLFAGIPTGAIVLAERDWAENNKVSGDMEEVVDGKQRLLTILEFICDKFPYRGHFYSELSSSDRWAFDEAQIMLGEIKNYGGYDKKLILETFLRVNGGGTSMQPQELDRVAQMLDEM